MILGSPLKVIAIFINGNAGLLGSENSDAIRTNRFGTDFILVLKLINQLGYALWLSYEGYFVQNPLFISGLSSWGGRECIGLLSLPSCCNVGLTYNCISIAFIGRTFAAVMTQFAVFYG
jgi:hypothetical protein